MTAPPPRIAYADLDADPLIRAVVAAAWHPGDPDRARELAAAVFPLTEPVAAAVARRVLASTGPFATLARGGLPDGDPRVARARNELATLGRVAHADHAAILLRHGLADAVPPRGGPAGDAPPAVREALAGLAAEPEWGHAAGHLAALHHAEGTGALAMHRVLRFTGDDLVGVPHPDPLREEDLVGGDARRAPLAEVLAAFAAGAPAVDALLYGPPGTGKSATVRALAAALGHTGLRLVQVDRDHIAGLGRLFALLDGAGPRCLVLLDDLVFDEGERGDRVLRAALEGDVGARPSNVAVWATSNRMRLLHETLTEREDDVEGALGRGERAALATRFGLRVGFGALSPDEYLSVVAALADRHGLPRDRVDRDEALRWSRERGLTPRAARQFADRLAAAAAARPGG